MLFVSDFPLRFVDSILGNFQSSMHAEDSFNIPPSFFNKEILFFFSKYSNLWKEQKFSKGFIVKFHHFIDGKYRNIVNWIIKKITSIKRQEHLATCKIIMDYAFLRRTILVNKNAIWQLDGDNLTILHMILSLQKT